MLSMGTEVDWDGFNLNSKQSLVLHCKRIGEELGMEHKRIFKQQLLSVTFKVVGAKLVHINELKGCA